VGSNLGPGKYAMGPIDLKFLWWMLWIWDKLCSGGVHCFRCMCVCMLWMCVCGCVCVCVCVCVMYMQRRPTA